LVVLLVIILVLFRLGLNNLVVRRTEWSEAFSSNQLIPSLSTGNVTSFTAMRVGFIGCTSHSTVGLVLCVMHLRGANRVQEVGVFSEAITVFGDAFRKLLFLVKLVRPM